MECRLCLWALHHVPCGHWWNKRQKLCCEKSIGVWWRMYKIHKRVTGGHDPDSDNKESSQPASGFTLQTLNDFPCRYIFSRQRWCFFKGVTIVKHIKGRVWIGCFGLANSITTWIYVYLLWTIIKYDVLAKNKKVYTLSQQFECKDLPRYAAYHWRPWKIGSFGCFYVIKLIFFIDI
jgi:hypothetical protein